MAYYKEQNEPLMIALWQLQSAVHNYLENRSMLLALGVVILKHYNKNSLNVLCENCQLPWQRCLGSLWYHVVDTPSHGISIFSRNGSLIAFRQPLITLAKQNQRHSKWKFLLVSTRPLSTKSLKKLIHHDAHDRRSIAHHASRRWLLFDDP